MSEQNFNRDWEQAYLEQWHEAAVGRLFRGLTHNLNGIIQAFSMQSELFSMTFSQTEELMEEVLATVELEDSVREKIAKLRVAINNRTRLTEQMQNKVQAAQDIMRRTRLLTDIVEGRSDYTVATVIRTEVEFMLADMFFKHQVQKELKLTDDLPPVGRNGVELHQMVFNLLANAAEALADQDGKPCLLIEAGQENDSIYIKVQDNGQGISAGDLPLIFQPFHTTKPDHRGLGLFLVKRIVEGWGGEIVCSNQADPTSFVLTIPVEHFRNDGG